MKREADTNIVYVIPVDYLLHTPGNPFCYDGTCSCHDDPLLMAEVATFVSEGLLTSGEATDFVNGKMI